MILSFRAIDNHLQRQLLKLMKYVDAEDTKEALYVGYSIIRSHIINIINKIKDYYKYHDKLTSLYSIDEMYIPGIKPKFIIPSLSDDVYETLGNEIKAYIDGLDTIGLDLSDYTIVNDFYSFRRYFPNMCYNSIYYALKELGTDNFNGLSALINTLNNKSFFDTIKISTSDIDDLFEFKHYPIKSAIIVPWNSYKDNYSVSHKAFKQLKKLNNRRIAEKYDDITDIPYIDANTTDDLFKHYIKDMILEKENKEIKLKNIINRLIDYDKDYNNEETLNDDTLENNIDTSEESNDKDIDTSEESNDKDIDTSKESNDKDIDTKEEIKKLQEEIKKIKKETKNNKNIKKVNKKNKKDSKKKK